MLEKTVLCLMGCMSSSSFQQVDRWVSRINVPTGFFQFVGSSNVHAQSPIGDSDMRVLPEDSLTILLLNTSCHVLANSVDPKPTNLDLHCYQICEFLSNTWIK